MPGDFNFQVRGIKEIKDEISGLGIAARRAAVVSSADYTLEMFKRESHPTYTYHSRSKAYGMSGSGGDWTYVRDGKAFTMQPVSGFFSAKQFHYVMACISDGSIEIPYTRTNRLSTGWKKVGDGLNVRIINDSGDYIQYVMGSKTQSRHEALIPWQTIDALLARYSQEIVKAAQNGIAGYIMSYKMSYKK